MNRIKSATKRSTPAILPIFAITLAKSFNLSCKRVFSESRCITTTPCLVRKHKCERDKGHTDDLDDVFFSLLIERLELLLLLPIIQRPDENDNENGNKDSNALDPVYWWTVVVLLQGKARLAAKSRCQQGKAMVNALRRCHKASDMRHHEGDSQRISWVAPSQEDNYTPGGGSVVRRAERVRKRGEGKGWHRVFEIANRRVES